MGSFSFLCVFALAAVALARPEEHYTDQYDHMDLDLVLGNPRLIKQYVKCLLGTGKCTKQGEELKSHISDALKTSCRKCTQKQHDSALKVVSHLRKNDQDSWKKLQQKYDPTNAFVAKYDAELRRLSA